MRSKPSDENVDAGDCSNDAHDHEGDHNNWILVKNDPKYGDRERQTPTYPDPCGRLPVFGWAKEFFQADHIAILPEQPCHPDYSERTAAYRDQGAAARVACRWVTW